MQLEIERREAYCQEHGNNAYAQRSEVNPFFGKIICANCNRVYSRIKYADRQGREQIKWRCGSRNEKGGYKLCSNRYITEESCKKLFIMAWNEMVEHRSDYEAEWQRIMAGEDVLKSYKTKLLMKHIEAGKITDFDAPLMMAVMDYIKVFEDGSLQIKFYDGTEFEVATE